MLTIKKILSLDSRWYHFIGLLTIGFSFMVGIIRWGLVDYMDRARCDALLNRGSWLDDNHRNWQPDGCTLHSYSAAEASLCLGSRKIVFIGDSITRKLYFQFAHIIDLKLPTAPPDDNHKHSDHVLVSASGTQLDFIWDPYLNSTVSRKFIDSQHNVGGGRNSEIPSLLVLGSGLWYLRYADSSGGLSAWEANVESILQSRGLSQAADEVVMLPVEEIVSAKLTAERLETMRPYDIDAMNSDLYHRIHPPSLISSSFFPGTSPALPVSLPLVFNVMLDPSETEDGLHFSDDIIKTQATVLLNLRCNDVLPKVFPFDKTCCSKYPWPTPLQFILLACTILFGPYTWIVARKHGQWAATIIAEDQLPIMVFSGAIAIIYIADRTGFWLKEQKQYDPWTFGFLSMASLAAGLATIKRGDKDLGFLNRDQTDEWKGWMQIAILIYHYLGASKISGIYNPIRVLVASYLFMTGYGHTTFYLTKADYSFLRVAQIMVRLNLLTITLAYTMNADYLSYYFAPLVSTWYLIVYGTMRIGSQFNDRLPFLLGKIIVSMIAMMLFFSEPWLLETLFDFLERLCAIHWSAKEWTFRVTLDLWIVYFGMLTSIVVIKSREHRITDHHLWPLTLKISIGLSIAAMLWFFAFELLQESKFTYNAWHPYISFVPIAAFIVFRNANSVMRSTSSRFFAFVGVCSLETFIIQYHLWLAGDTKAILLILPGTRWRPFNFVITSIVFVYVSHMVAQTTGKLTGWICGVQDQTLPTTAQGFTEQTSRGATPSSNHVESYPLNSQTDGDNRKEDDSYVVSELNAPGPSRRWADRLAEGSFSGRPGFRVFYGETRWTSMGVKTRAVIIFGLMWLANVLWKYP